MRFVTFEADGRTYAGVLSGDYVIDLAPAGFTTILDLVRHSVVGKSKVEKLVAEAPIESRFPLERIKLLAPIPQPRKLICVGLNYLDHARETGAEVPKVPTIFNKFATAVIGPGDTVVLPKVSKAPDYEAELAFVIGTGGRHIAAENWADHVFGYTIVNDVTARDYQKATSQWLMGKTFDTFAPLGPWIVTADEIPDPHKLGIQLEINGELLQDSNTSELIFKIPELIEFLSSVFTLEPGDIVSTGTPAGVGFTRKPPRYLHAGEEMIVRVEKIGELRNPVAAEAVAA
jgi:2-keto-4-pentenoate hydratase/2-oxohepta-3-ene-1,7-dioic acid hydratase in catechol pathway